MHHTTRFHTQIYSYFFILTNASVYSFKRIFGICLWCILFIFATEGHLNAVTVTRVNLSEQRPVQKLITNKIEKYMQRFLWDICGVLTI